MYKFNEFQVEVINRGIDEEIEKDVRMHSGMKYETAKCSLTFQKVQDKLSYDVLVECYNFWLIYFYAGEGSARKYMELRDKERKEKFAQLDEEMRKNLQDNSKL